MASELDPACHSEDARSRVPQLRPNEVKKKKKELVCFDSQIEGTNLYLPVYVCVGGGG